MSIRYVEQDRGVYDRQNHTFIPEDTGNKMWLSYLTWKENNAPIGKPPSPYHIVNDITGEWTIDWNYTESVILKDIDSEAERQREEISPEPLLEIIHGRKLNEAERFKADGYLPVDGVGFPYMVAERDSMRVIDPSYSTKDAADKIIDASKDYDEVMAEIEKERRIGKEKVMKYKGDLNKMNSVANESKNKLEKVKVKKDKGK